MLGELEVLELQVLYKQGYSLKQISREMGHSINTVRKYIRNSTRPRYKSRAAKPGKLDNYKLYLQQRIADAKPHWIPAAVLYLEIKSQGYCGGISLVRAYIYPLKPKPHQRPLVRFETQPGEQMQVDFAHFKHEGQVFYAFVAVLGYSRMAFVQFVTNQDIETVIIKRHAYGEGRHKLHTTFYDFAKHYGLQPRVCKPYSPQTKGKVERMISYLRYSFYHPFVAGKVTLGLDDLNCGVMAWLNLQANCRIHATTGDIPIKRWVIEQPFLLKIPPSYTTDYGDKKSSITTDYKVVMEQHTIPLQHDLSIYDALLTSGGRS